MPMKVHFGTPRVPLPLAPGASAPGRTLSAHLADTSDPHRTMDLVAQAVSGFVDGAVYDSAARAIQLKHGSAVVASVDATPFVVDGMVSSVTVSGGNLVVTWNTDSGKAATVIPLADIFDPSNYYAKADADATFVAKEQGKGLSSNDYTGADREKVSRAVVYRQDRSEGYTAVDIGSRVGNVGVSSLVVGNQCSAITSNAVAIGKSTTAGAANAMAEGDHSSAGGASSHAEGGYTETSNSYEHAQGKYNLSHKANGTWGSPGNTLSSVGIGTSAGDRKNATEVMQDGKVFILGLGGYDGTNPGAAGVRDLAAAVGGKQDAIQDLADIRAGAAAGAGLPAAVVSAVGTQYGNPSAAYVLDTPVTTYDGTQSLGLVHVDWSILEGLPVGDAWLGNVRENAGLVVPASGAFTPDSLVVEIVDGDAVVATARRLAVATPCYADVAARAAARLTPVFDPWEIAGLPPGAVVDLGQNPFFSRPGGFGRWHFAFSYDGGSYHGYVDQNPGGTPVNGEESSLAFSCLEDTNPDVSYVITATRAVIGYILGGQAGKQLLAPGALAGAVRYDLGVALVPDGNSVFTDTAVNPPTDYVAAALLDRTMNCVQLTLSGVDELRLAFPAATDGKARDFALRVEVGTGSEPLAAPRLVPPGGVAFENPDGVIPELADGTSAAKGVTLVYFTETAPNVFLVRGRELRGLTP